MRKFYILFLAFLFSTGAVQAQCNLLPNAVQGIILDYQSTNLANCSGVGYNPTLSLYYGVRAGNSSFPLETWTAAGGQLFTTTAGFDWRGMWWNPNLGQLEGNGYATGGIWKCNLDASGYATATGATIFSGQNQPDAQSVGDYDYVNNEIIYYFNGAIHRYSRATNAFLGTIPLTGTPVALSNLNNNTAMYTGCPGKEFALLDYVNKRVYLYQRSNGAYQGQSQLPASAVTTNSFRTSWANGFIWLFDLGTGNWVSFRVLDVTLPQNAFVANALRMDENSAKIYWESGNGPLFEGFDVERSINGVDFTRIGTVTPNATSFNLDGQGHWELDDLLMPAATHVFYRVQAHLKSGETQSSGIMELLSEEIASTEITAWPVPADHVLHVKLEPSMLGGTMQCFDALGKLVHESNIASGLPESTISTADWEPGVYHLRVKRLKGPVLKKRLVVTH